VSPALRVEWAKLRRSTVTLTTTALLTLVVPAMALGFFSVAQNAGTGPLADKAGAFLVGEGWEGFVGAVDQIAAVALFLGAGIVVAWVFGREHADRTFPSLFALPVSRSSIALAKFAVLTVWIAAVAVLVVAVTLVLGLAADVGPVDAGVIAPALVRLLTVAASAGLLSLTVGIVASAGRGYLPAIGAIILVVAAAQIAVLFGTGGWFPFAVPGLIAVAGNDGAPEVTGAQVAVIPALVGLLVWSTVHWWRRAEAV
jgi:ABC-2 type transport system permease protein